MAFMKKPKPWRCYARPPRSSCRETTWRLVLTSPEGLVTVQACGATEQAEAERLAAEVQHSYRETGGPPGLAPEGITVGELVDRNLAWRVQQGPEAEGCALATLEKIRRVREDLAGSLMAVEVAKLRRADVVLARDRLQAGPRGKRGPSAVNGLLAFVASAWSWGLERGLVETSWPKVKRLRVPDTEKRPPTRDEVARFFAYLAARPVRAFWLPHFSAIYDTTARVSDVLTAQGKSLDRKSGRLRLWVQKNRKWLDVYLSRSTLDLIPPCAPSAWLFPGKDPKKPATRHTIKSVFSRACGRLGIEKVDVHSFRRKGVEDACRTEGVHEKQAMKLTGHMDPAVFHGYQQRAQDDMAAVWTKFHEGRGPHPAAAICITEHHDSDSRIGEYAGNNGPGGIRTPDSSPRVQPLAKRLERRSRKAMPAGSRPDDTATGRDVFRDAERAAGLVGAFVQIGGKGALDVLEDFESDPTFLRAAIVAARDALGIEQEPSRSKEHRA